MAETGHVVGRVLLNDNLIVLRHKHVNANVGTNALRDVLSNCNNVGNQKVGGFLQVSAKIQALHWVRLVLTSIKVNIIASAIRI